MCGWPLCCKLERQLVATKVTKSKLFFNLLLLFVCMCVRNHVSVGKRLTGSFVRVHDNFQSSGDSGTILQLLLLLVL